MGMAVNEAGFSQVMAILNGANRGLSCPLTIWLTFRREHSRSMSAVDLSDSVARYFKIRTGWVFFLGNRNVSRIAFNSVVLIVALIIHGSLIEGNE